MILISPTAYKGTLSPWTAARIMGAAGRKIFSKEQIRLAPLADGGDGTLEVLLPALGGKIRQTRVRGPLGQAVLAKWGYVQKTKTAIIEIAEASGLKLIKGKNKILEATTFGTGQLIAAALDAGSKTILIGVGGTATSDGGAGALEALGLKYFDAKKKRLNGSPRDLAILKSVDWSELYSRLKKAKIFVLCDVKNPLLGANGSAHTFAPQKGATPSQVKFLEHVLRRWSRFARFQTKNKPGAGAAGALAFGLSGFLGAKLMDGCSAIMKLTQWEKLGREARIIITGEGQLDKTSFGGKVIGAICRKKGRGELGIVCGRFTAPEKILPANRIKYVVEMGEKGLKQPEIILEKATLRLFWNWI